jgi:hypothetical protein
MIQDLIIAGMLFESGCWPIRLIEESQGLSTGVAALDPRLPAPLERDYT